MKTGKKFHTHFEKASPRTAEEIKAVCDKMQLNAKKDYDIRSNGNHIWVEVGEKKQQFWSPMLHLRLEKSENQTCIKGEFAENPGLWLTLHAIQLVSIAIFITSLVAAYFKYNAEWNFNPELFIMFGMVSVWFALYLVSQRYKRKGARQIEELHDFVDYIAAA
jgi:Flp pilus assembly protein TadB